MTKRKKKEIKQTSHRYDEDVDEEIADDFDA